MSDQFSFGPVSILSGLLLAFLCLFADHVHFMPPRGQWSAALRDNAVHGTIAFLSWAMYSDWRYKVHDFLLCSLCGVLAMALDVDHFMMARTISLKKALSQPGRPPLHASTIIPVIAIAIYFICRVLSWKTGWTLAAMLTVAWLSHHIRDGIRRGLWFPPFGSTPPVPFSVYVLTTIALPVSLRLYRGYLDNWENVEGTESFQDDMRLVTDV